MSERDKLASSGADLDEVLEELAPDQSSFEELSAAFERAKRRPPRARLIAEGEEDLPDVGQKILIVGDAHFEPHQSLRRAKWLGRMVADHRPDAVVFIGDCCSFDSLGLFAKPGGTEYAAQRYWDDIYALNTALEIYHEFLDGYECDHIVIEGNHENRIQRWLDDNVKWQGNDEQPPVISYTHMDFEQRGYLWVPYLQPLEIAGFNAVHELRTPKGMAAGAKYIARWCLNNLPGSWFWGHSHFKDIAHEARGMAINVGCFFEHEMAYSNFANRFYDRGIMILNNAKDGFADEEWWSMERIRARYGG